MKTMKIYEPAMCCSTGLCGVGVNPELLRLSAALDGLKKNGVNVGRYNLNNAPQEFIKNADVNAAITQSGTACLPIVVLDGKIVITKRYPTNKELAELLEVPMDYLSAPTKNNSCCGGNNKNGNGCC